MTDNQKTVYTYHQLYSDSRNMFQKVRFEPRATNQSYKVMAMLDSQQIGSTHCQLYINCRDTFQEILFKPMFTDCILFSYSDKMMAILYNQQELKKVSGV